MYAHKVGELAFLEAKLSLDRRAAAAVRALEGGQAGHRQAPCKASAATPRTAASRGQRRDMIDRMSREEDMLKHRLADLEAERPALDRLL